MAKIIHACGHEVEYKAVKDKAPLAARSCPACEYAAKATVVAAPKLFWVKKPLGAIRIVTTPNGQDPVRSQVEDSKYGPRNELYYDGFATREEAETRVRQLVDSGKLKLTEGDGRGPFEPWRPTPAEAEALKATRVSSDPFDADIRSLEGNEDIEYPYGRGGPEI